MRIDYHYGIFSPSSNLLSRSPLLSVDIFFLHRVGASIVADLPRAYYVTSYVLYVRTVSLSLSLTGE